VIDQNSFDNIANYVGHAKQATDAKVLVGGSANKAKGYFVEPTIIETTQPKFKTMVEEIFGPVLTVYSYDDKDLEAAVKLCDETSPYALTGAIFAQDRMAVERLKIALRHSAGHFYVNDKPTGAVVGQQPFGGARASGTNDKAGSVLNLYRWVSPRTIKETFAPPKDYRYPFMG
jgi:1-pyrroline-5-carboxylate dehydrogenase